MGLGNLIGMILGVVVAYFGSRGFVGVFFGIVLTALIIGAIFVTMQEDMWGFINN